MTLEKEKILENLKWLLRQKKAPYTLLSFYRCHHCVTKFADGRITQNSEDDDRTIYVKAIDKNRVGVASTNSLEKDDLMRALEDAAEMARLAPESPQTAVTPQNGKIEEVATYFAKTAAAGAGERDALISRIFGKAKESKAEASGTILTGIEEMAVLDSRGKAIYQPFTIASVKLIAQRNSQTGFAAMLSRDIEKISAADVTMAAVQKALLNKDPKEIEPAKYDCIFEPEALGEILNWLGYIGFGAKRFAEHTSFMCGRIEEKIMGNNVTIYDDGLSADGLPMPFDFEGVPRKKVTLIENGVAKGIVYDSQYAHLYGRESTGHALTPDSTEGPMPLNLSMKPGDAAPGEMAASLKRGVLVTRFHYVNGLLDPRTALMTGLTRDGTFLIQNGKIKCALKNMRFTDSILDAFKRVAMVSKEQRLVGDPTSDIGAALVPAILIRNFTFTGKAG